MFFFFLFRFQVLFRTGVHRNGHTVQSREVEAGTPVTLVFRHSVQKTMIYEYLVVNDSEDGLVLKSTKYQSMGVGLPFSKEDGEFRRSEERRVGKEWRALY